VKSLLGPAPAAIRNYEREFRTDFSGIGSRLKFIQPVSKKALIRRIRDAEVTFIADFHTFSQAQKTALRLIRESIQPGEDWLIGLEVVPSRFQSALDAFQSGKIGLEAFHQIIRYKDEWGFPWENYAPIFEWARQNSVKIVALNGPGRAGARSRAPTLASGFSKTMEELKLRDRWAASLISILLSGGQSRRMIVLYGELHVGTKHIPDELRIASKLRLGRPVRSISIHQNDDILYWRLAREAKELQTEIIKLRRNVFCVLASTPWAKLQSLISWLEGEAAQIEQDESTDYLSLLVTYGKTLAEFFGVESPHQAYESLTVRTIDELDFVDTLFNDHRFSRTERALIRFHVLNNQRLYIPPDIAYLASPSQNATAELAAIHLLRTQTRFKLLFQHERDDFFRLVLEASFAFLGSLILNPRRKCDLPADHRSRLKALAEGAKPMNKAEVIAREITLSLLRKTGNRREVTRLMNSPRHAPAAMLAARYLGQIFGKKLHKAILAETLDITRIRDFFFTGKVLSRGKQKKDVTQSFEERYIDLVKWIDRSSIAASKKDSL